MSNLKRCQNPFCTGGVEKASGVPICQKCLTCLTGTPKCLYQNCDQTVQGVQETEKYFQPKKSFCLVHLNKNFVPCKKLASGFCSFKSKCRFNHQLCRFHAQGSCRLGKFCRNVHIVIKK